MKLIKIIIVIVVIMSLLLLPGCGRSANITGNESSVVTSIIHGSPAGVWFMLTTAISESLSSKYKGSIMHGTPGHTYANVFRLNDYEAEFALTHTNLSYDAYRGTGQFEDKLEEIGGVAVLYPSIAQFVIKKENGLSTFEEFINNKIPLKISIGERGGNSQLALMSLLAIYGLTFDDLTSWGCELYEAANRTTAELFADERIEGTFMAISAPTPSIVEMAVNDELTMLSFSEYSVRIMEEQYGYDAYEIPVGTYNFSKEPIASFTTYSMLAASLQTPDETVYKVTKSIYENVDYLRTVHSALSDLNGDLMVGKMLIPMHPGAEKYYREIGLMD